jgi:small subunit ribosomal protein S4
MARYTGPTSKKARAFGEAIYGNDKAFEKRKFAPGQHGPSRKKKQKSDYGVQLMEKQKAKYTYEATKRHGVTGTVLLQLLEARLDNVVYRLGIAPTRRAARQLVSHKHVTVNGIVLNVPSAQIRPGDIITVRGKSRNNGNLETVGVNREVKKLAWLDWNPERLEGRFIAYPEREQIPEKINEQLIVELYSK